MKHEVWLMLGSLALLFAMLGYWRPVLMFYIAAFVAPWQDLMVDVGLRLTLYTLAMVGFIVAMLRHGWGRWRSVLSARVWWPLAALLSWAVVWSLSQVPTAANVQISGGVLRSPAIRPLVQAASFALMVFPVIVAPFVLSRREQLARMAAAYLGSMLILLLIGWWQFIVANTSGYNPLPMGAVNAWFGGIGGVERDAIDLGQGGRVMYRMSSLGGEPRWLAQSIGTVLLLLQIGWMAGRLRVSFLSVLLYGFFFASLVATQAMSGLYLWILGASVLLVYHVLHRQPRRDAMARIQKWFIASALALAGVLGWLLSQPSVHDDKILGFVAYWLQRIASRGFIADFDVVVLDFLKAEPLRALFGVGLGNVHFYADAYLSPYFREFAGGTSFVADSGWLRLTSELGLVGLGLFLWWCKAIWTSMETLHEDPAWSNSAAVLRSVFLIAVIGYLARGTTYSPIAFMLLAVCMVPVISAANRP